jgi:RNA polymerase sigma factor (sigma-70 family)
MTEEKPLELTMRLRNNLLKSRRLELGLTSIAFAKTAGVSLTAYIQLETMKLSPVGRRGWKDIAWKIANFHGLTPEDLWPDVILAVVDPVAVRKISYEEVYPLLASQGSGVSHGLLPEHNPEALAEHAEQKALLEDAFHALSPREENVLRRCLAGETITEIARKYEVSNERVKQLADHANVKIRKVLSRYR